MRSLSTKLSPQGSAFLRAALDPFSDVTLPAVGVPDSFGAATLKFHHQQNITATPNSAGNIRFMAVPTPDGGIAAIEGTYTANFVDFAGAQPTGSTSRSVATDFAQAPVGAIIPYSTTISAITGTNAQNWLNAGLDSFRTTGFRTIGFGVEVRYTGTTLTDQGRMYCARMPITMREGRIKMPGTPTANTPFAASHWLRESATQGLLIYSGSQLSQMPNYRQHDMREGAMSVSVVENGQWEMMDYSPAIFTERADNWANPDVDASKYAIGLWGYNSTLGGGHQGELLPVGGLGNHTPLLFSLEGLDPAKGVVEIRLSHFIERTIDPLSSFWPFVTKSPGHDPLALGLVSSVSKGLPAMVPVAMNGFGEWWRRILSAVGGVGRIAGSLGIPVVSPIGSAVGGIAEILGNLDIV